MTATFLGTSGRKRPGSIVDLSRLNFGYKYPEGLALTPGNDFHDSLVDKILDRARIGAEENAKRHSDWDYTDKMLTAYVDLTTSEKALQRKQPDRPVRIVVPYSYAVLETILTYLTQVFIADDPVFQYDSTCSRDTIAVKQLEVLVNKQVQYYKAALALYSWMRDGLGYGIGAVAPCWKAEYRWVDRDVEEPVETMDGTGMATTTKRVREPIFEGTELIGIGPRYLLMDPNTPAHKVQNGEFIGWIEETNQHRILELERESPEEWFNAKYIYKAGPTNSSYAVNTDLYATNSSMKPTTLVHMYVNVIPDDWGIKGGAGNKDGFYPEKWLFTVADDWCIVRAVRMDTSHNKYPIAINAPDYDGYSTFPLARLDITQGLQHTLDWLFNSHITNVKKIVNNTLVVDPMMIEVGDLRDAREGGIVRARDIAWGKSIKDAIFQLPVQDVTRGNISDAETVISLMQRVSAATDNMMGLMRQGGERVSATESRTVATSAVNRLEKTARLISLQGMQDLGMFFAANIQDYMANDVQLKVLGNYPQELIEEYAAKNGDMIITPADLQIPYTVIPRDGSLPVDTKGVAESWLTLYGYISGSEILMQQYDMQRIFMHIARLLGAKNVNDFQIKGATIQDAIALREREKGNIVPVEELANAQS